MAQSYFASGYSKWPAVTAAPLNHRTHQALGNSAAAPLNVSVPAKTLPAAKMTMDRAGIH